MEDPLLTLLNYINRNKLNTMVKINRRINNPYPLIKRSDILLLSSKFEGLPNVLLEALALNKFIISSNCPTGPKEILDNGKGGLLFEVGNYEQLSRKILIYQKNYKLCLKKKKYVFVSNLSDAIREVDTSEKNKPTKNKSKINDKIGLSILFHH